MTDTATGGRFSSSDRHIADEEEIELTSVGVDIGSSTSHLVFSRVLMERVGARYIVAQRETIHEPPIQLTPYADGDDIDAKVLGEFVEASFKSAGIARSDVDTGALILTGVAVRRRNARAIGDLFAAEAGKFVAVSAGDGLEATMAAHGSGAVKRSSKSDGLTVNVDIGGGTTKIAHCRAGKVERVTAVDCGARLIVLDESGRIIRLEPTGKAHANDVGVALEIGSQPSRDELDRIAEVMATRIVEATGLSKLSSNTEGMLLLPPLPIIDGIDALTFSGGVSEFVYGNVEKGFGDLGPQLAKHARDKFKATGASIEQPVATIRATVVGASQYTVQLSGTTIYIEPRDTVPLKNVPVIVPEFDFTKLSINEDQIKHAIEIALTRLDLVDNEMPVALGFRWKGSASFSRLNQFGEGLRTALFAQLSSQQPLVLVSDGDIGGLVGIHLREEMNIETPVISIDGITLNEFDYIDIGEIIPSSGAVPVVIKSLVFPSSTTTT
ncbi:MAG: ethanolamine ammonia-lyase reactivating factor EutA [Alphaproteobacteria bacterium]